MWKQPSNQSPQNDPGKQWILRKLHQFNNVTPGPGRHLHGRNPNQRFRQHAINPALESVNLWNAFPDPTFNVPIPAQDGTYMAETFTNDLDNMEYIAPRFLHCFSDLK
ncbi:unnamed protein product [Bursaphelenchus xylophilus]|uniref:(pine wood nematode) hypothetical protein n=1 Tax=Bursaphelenchus xylophilus TaxID=6326 RepID=A0A811K7U1_BURXY|nr:unnamed protein product [Bursaphelenchus xylophilus]CAG9089229.1 unnamed protein product [Bursaphelenchus xylophilus]